MDWRNELEQDCEIKWSTAPKFYDLFNELKCNLENFNDFEDFKNHAFDTIGNFIYDTDAISFDQEKRLDLCYYWELETGEKVPNDLSWTSLSLVIEKTAVSGLSLIVNSYLSEILNNLETFIDANELDFKTIDTQDRGMYFPPVAVRDIENGIVTEYRTFNSSEISVDVYSYKVNDDLTLYFHKRIS